MTDFHTLTAAEVLKKLKTAKEGLSKKEAKLRLVKHGLNRLPAAKKKSRLLIFIEQFKSPLVYILAIAGIVTLFLKDYTDAVVIWLAVIINAAVGYIQEAKANNALSALKELVVNKVIVLRGGKERLLSQDYITVGDVIKLRPGDKVPADGRIIKSHDLKINEAALTGEWAPVEKKEESMDRETFFADRVNMAFMGTVIESGFGEMVVTATARQTEFGRIAKLIKETEENETPYQRRLANFSRILGAIIILISLFIFIEGIITGGEFLEMFTTAVAVAVAALPEGLPMAMTVILAIGMQKILKRKGLVRKLASAETLGSTSIICTDKTGTLTQGIMEVNEVIADSAEDKDKIYQIITLLSEAFIESINGKLSEEVLRGRPTDRALLSAGHIAGYTKEKLSRDYNELDRIPFSSAQKFSAALFSVRDGSPARSALGALGGRTGKTSGELLAMGAPEIIFARCKGIKASELNQRVNKMTAQGLRVLSVAARVMDNTDARSSDPARLLRQPADSARRAGKPSLGPGVAAGRHGAALTPDDVKDLHFIGFVTIKDPLRASAKQAIKTCQLSGLRPVIITGDHKLTAKAIANELGLHVKEKNILEGKDIEKLTDKQLKQKVQDIIVYARVMPEHKLRIVNAWQSLGKVVAMTGDGINDAPALKKADVGVALGSGTTVAKEVSDLVLLNDDFSVIVAAVEEGRVIIDNVRKVITYLLSSSFSEIILITTAIMLGWPLPVLAVHILWVNLIEDGLPNFALAFEPKEDDIMKRPPLERSAPLLNSEMKFLIFVIGIMTDIMLLGIFYYFYKYSGYSLIHVQSLIFAALAIDSRFFVYSCRSLRQNIWRTNFFSNKLLFFSTIIGTVLLIVVFYHPALQLIFKTVALTVFDWTILIALGLLNVVFIEVGKMFYISRKKID